MSEANFIDYVRLECRSGKGGAGSLHHPEGVKRPKESEYPRILVLTMERRYFFP